jgi:hypothetical protein
MISSAARGFRALLLSGALVAPSQTLAWGEPGHQVVGYLADQILKVKDPQAWANLHSAIAPYNLAVVTTWAEICDRADANIAEASMPF